ncbi:MAG: hypothetical protein LBK68_00270 [Candidatus Margulisbacteria bacterium]|jgi:hypothetical protein|nr:hypothetical protein [Candidatus Margulisiibacteriota bacterium]
MRFLNCTIRTNGYDLPIELYPVAQRSTNKPEEDKSLFGSQTPLDEKNAFTMYGYGIPKLITFIQNTPSAPSFDSIQAESQTIGNDKYKIVDNQVHCKKADGTEGMITKNGTHYIIGGEYYAIDEDKKLAKVFTGDISTQILEKGILYEGSTYVAIGNDVYRVHNGLTTQYLPDNSKTYLINAKPYVVQNGELQLTVTRDEFKNAADTGIPPDNPKYKAINGQIYMDNDNGQVILPVSGSSVEISGTRYTIDAAEGVLVKTDVSTIDLFERWTQSKDTGVLHNGITYKTVVVDDRGTIKVLTKKNGSPDTAGSLEEHPLTEETGTYVIGGEHYRVVGSGDGAKLAKTDDVKKSSYTGVIDASTGYQHREGDNIPNEDNFGGKVEIDVGNANTSISASVDLSNVDNPVFNIQDLSTRFLDNHLKVGLFNPSILPDFDPAFNQIFNHNFDGTPQSTIPNLNALFEYGFNIPAINTTLTPYAYAGLNLFDISMGDGQQGIGHAYGLGLKTDTTIGDFNIRAGANFEWERQVKEQTDWFNWGASLGASYAPTFNWGGFTISLAGFVQSSSGTKHNVDIGAEFNITQGALRYNPDNTPIWKEGSVAQTEQYTDKHGIIQTIPAVAWKKINNPNDSERYQQDRDGNFLEPWFTSDPPPYKPNPLADPSNPSHDPMAAPSEEIDPGHPLYKYAVAHQTGPKYYAYADDCYVVAQEQDSEPDIETGISDGPDGKKQIIQGDTDVSRLAVGGELDLAVSFWLDQAKKNSWYIQDSFLIGYTQETFASGINPNAMTSSELIPVGDYERARLMLGNTLELGLRFRPKSGKISGINPYLNFGWNYSQLTGTERNSDGRAYVDSPDRGSNSVDVGLGVRLRF